MFYNISFKLLVEYLFNVFLLKMFALVMWGQSQHVVLFYAILNI